MFKYQLQIKQYLNSGGEGETCEREKKERSMGGWGTGKEEGAPSFPQSPSALYSRLFFFSRLPPSPLYATATQANPVQKWLLFCITQWFFYPSIAEPITCPVCSAQGVQADNECEANIINKTCLETDPVCFLAIGLHNVGPKFRERGCGSRKWFNEFKDHCEKRKDCAITMCETSGCKAEFPTSGILFDFKLLCRLKELRHDILRHLLDGLNYG